MGQLRILLRRHGLALGLTTALVGMVWGAALPAVEERAQARAVRRAAERDLEIQTEQLHRAQLWLAGLEQGDAQTEARLTQERLRSPDLEGPVIFVPSPGPGEDDSR